MTVKMRRGRRTRKRSCRDDVGTPRVSVASVRALLAESAAARESATTAPRTSNAPTLTVQIPPGISPAAANAQLASRGLALNALLVNAFSAPNFGETDDLTPYLTALEQMVVTVRSGDLGDAEGLLLAQAVTLNAIFVRCAQHARAYLNGQYVEALERYLRLALKAQGQCRATLETLAVLKNPTTVFARQANIAQG